MYVAPWCHLVIQCNTNKEDGVGAAVAATGPRPKAPSTVTRSARWFNIDLAVAAAHRKESTWLRMFVNSVQERLIVAAGAIKSAADVGERQCKNEGPSYGPVSRRYGWP